MQRQQMCLPHLHETWLHPPSLKIGVLQWGQRRMSRPLLMYSSERSRPAISHDTPWWGVFPQAAHALLCGGRRRSQSDGQKGKRTCPGR